MNEEKQNSMIFRFVDLNSKSRKGLYLYVKGKGKMPSRYYKLTDPSFIVDDYLDYYHKRYIDNTTKDTLYRHKKAVWNEKIRENDLIKKGLAKSKDIKSMFKPFTVKTSKMFDILKLTNERIVSIYTEVLSDLVRDKSLIPKLIRQDNKLKSRLTYDIDVHCMVDGKIMSVGNIRDIGNHTLNDIKIKYQALLTKGITLDSDTWRYIKGMLNRNVNNEIRDSVWGRGTVHSLNTKLTFARGK